jgi:RNA-binding protein Musashi
VLGPGQSLTRHQIEIKKAQPRGAGIQPKSFGAAQGGRFNQNFGANAGMSSMGGMGGMGGFDPNAMAMMYQNMMKGSGMGGSGFPRIDIPGRIRGRSVDAIR